MLVIGGEKLGNYVQNWTKAKQKLGWTPKIKMEALCREMVEADIKLVEKGDLTS